jgi:putative Mg2+ transporter-C (MgtC) family protein
MDGRWAALMSYIASLPWSTAGRITVAALLGGVVGLEREWTGHVAGLRTTMLVAVGSCLFTVLSIDGFPVHGSNQDTGRVAAQIVTGIGFLGAGALFQSKNHIKGLTTAATIWLVAAIGMAAGAGLFFIAIWTTLIAEFVLVGLKPLGLRLQRRRQFGWTPRRVLRTAIRQPGPPQVQDEDDWPASD